MNIRLCENAFKTAPPREQKVPQSLQYIKSVLAMTK